MTARRLAGLSVAAATLIAPAAAQGHVSVHPNTIPAGAFATLNIRVPGEQAGAHVIRVDTLLPPGFISADYQNVPGWTARVVFQRLARPVQSDDGPIDTEVSQIVWTWIGPLGRVDNNQFIQFPLSVAIPTADRGRSLQFKTVQTYSNGQVVHWIGPAGTDTPAPTINVTAPGGVIEDVAGAEAGPAPGQLPAAAAGSATATAPAPKSGGGASKGLAIAALVVGALGLAVGLGGVLLARRNRVAA